MYEKLISYFDVIYADETEVFRSLRTCVLTEKFKNARDFRFRKLRFPNATLSLDRYIKSCDFETSNHCHIVWKSGACSN